MQYLAFLALLAPAAMYAVGLFARFDRGQPPHTTLRLARVATVGGLIVAALTALAIGISGSITSPTLGVGSVGLSVRLDPLSTVMFVLVAFVGAVVVQFSRNYLDGDPGHARFMGNLNLTVGSVCLLVLAGNLVHLFVAWVATSLALHTLLVFYSERRAAVVAARKKFIVARIGDAALLGAVLILIDTFQTADLAAVLDGAARLAETRELPGTLGIAGVLIAVAAILKSAMFPTHGWLLEVMETPTPVSALLHAGIINGGTFLVVRLGDVMMPQTPALVLLVLFGGFTALFASVSMVTQTSVKVSLAYSSAAHMGFMLMLTGLGAYSVAILHLVAHSFYKAHAFLSSGSVVDYARATGSGPKEFAPGPVALLASFAGAFAIFIGLGLAFGVPFAERPVSMTLGAIFVMALTHLLARGLAASRAPYVLLRTAGSAAAVATAFFVLESGAAALLAPALPAGESNGPTAMVLMGAVGVAFTGVSLLQILLPTLTQKPAFHRAYVHLKNGLYANTVFDRWVGAFR
jgi:NAD(P)H-quinone oxidoreductase subunit 5